MKKVIVFFLAAIASISLNAKAVNVLSGDGSVIKEKECAVITYDVSEAQFQHEKTLQEESGENWEVHQQMALNAFIKGFNNFSKKGLQVVNSSDNAKYTIVVKISNIDRKQVMGAAMWGMTGLKIYCTVDFIDNASGNVVLSVGVDGYMCSKGSYKPTDRINHGFDELGWHVAKLG